MYLSHCNKVVFPLDYELLGVGIVLSLYPFSTSLSVLYILRLLVSLS